MLYTHLTKKALALMFDIHKEQFDKGGNPYVFHPYAVADDMKDEISTCVALLHDVTKCADITETFIKNCGFPSEVTDALTLLTRKNLPYFVYIRRLKLNPIAVQVKLADLRHNCNISRLKSPSGEDYERVDKYKKAIEILTSADEDESNEDEDVEDDFYLEQED